MQELVKYIVEQLVDDKENVEVEAVEGDVLQINIYASKSEIGKIIGKQGRIARAIRSIVRASAIKQNIRCTVEIIEK